MKNKKGIHSDDSFLSGEKLSSFYVESYVRMVYTSFCNKFLYSGRTGNEKNS